jgi:steroid delta-isomerase-like uncharacterized protein
VKGGKTMSIEEENVSLIRKQITAVNEKNYQEVLKSISPEFVRHDLADALPNLTGTGGVSNLLQIISAGFSDLRFEILDIFGSEDRVTMRFIATGTQTGEFLNVPPTGKRIEINGIHIYRISGEKVVETWQLADVWGLMRQVGAVDFHF